MAQRELLYAQLTEGEKGYIAGVLDGDGCISIHRYHCPGYERWYYSLRIQVSNTCFEFCQWFEDRLGGHIYKRRMTEKNPRWSDSYAWTLEDNRLVQALLLEVTSYLVRKRAIAEAVIQYPLLPKGSTKAPDTIVYEQAALFERVKALNAKGPKDNSEPTGVADKSTRS